MQPVLAHPQAVLLAERLRRYLFHVTEIENEWHKTTGGYQYYLWWDDGRKQSPLAIRIETLLDLMFDWNLDYYIQQTWAIWNRTFVPDYRNYRSGPIKRVMLDYREEQLHYGKAQQHKATTEAAAKRETEREQKRAERVVWKGIELILIRSSYDLDQRSQLQGTMEYSNRRDRGIQKMAGTGTTIQLPGATSTKLRRGARSQSAYAASIVTTAATSYG